MWPRVAYRVADAFLWRGVWHAPAAQEPTLDSAAKPNPLHAVSPKESANPT